MRAYVRNRIGIHVGLYDKISSATERVSSPHFRTLRNPIEDLAVHRRPVMPISFNHCTVISGFVFEFVVKLRSHFRVPCTLLLYTPWGFRIKYNISSHPHTLVVLAHRWMYNDVWLIVYSSLLGQGSYVYLPAYCTWPYSQNKTYKYTPPLTRRITLSLLIKWPKIVCTTTHYVFLCNIKSKMCNTTILKYVIKSGVTTTVTRIKKYHRISMP